MTDREISQPIDEPESNVQAVRRHAREQPDELAYLHLAEGGDEEAVTWAQLDRRSSQLAGALAARGAGFGDRLGLALRNSPELVYGFLAAWKLGAVPVPIRWDVPEWELSRLREAVEPKIFLGPDDLDWIDDTANAPVPDLPEVLSPHSNGICSSGATGTPKVILTNSPPVFNPVMGIPIASAFMEVTRPQRILVLAPMYHINAFATLYAMLSGDQLYVMQKFDAARIVDVIERHGITTFTATPTMLQRIADLPDVDRRDLGSLEWILQGAAPMPPSLVHRWAGLIGAEKIVMAYGSTEGLGLAVLTGDEWMEHEGSVGRGFSGAEFRILDDAGNDLPTGEIGNVYIRSPRYQGTTYLGRAEQIPMTDDGFGTVGDVGYLDEEEYLYLVDRRVDLIITGGANVYPAEVEVALIDHPQVADVVVIGVKDAEWGRRVHAIIQPADPGDPPTLEDVRAFAKDRILPYKVPKSVEIVDAIPRSEAMKVNRGRLVAERGG